MRLSKLVFLSALMLGPSLPLAAFGQFQPPSPEELSMTSDPKAPGAAAVYLYREETEDDPHHFRTVYARIKILTEAGKDLATVHITYNRNFVFFAAGDNSSRMASGMSNNWSAPDVNHAGEDVRVDTNAFAGHTNVSAIEARTIHPDGTIVPLTGTPADLLKTKAGNTQFNELTFNMPSVEVGSILEYRYQVRYDPFQSAPEWQVQQPYFVHRARYVFTPAQQFLPQRNDVAGGGGGSMSNSALIGDYGEVLTDIHSANILPPGSEVKVDGQGRYAVELTDIPPIPQEAFMPPLGGQIYQINYVYTATPDAKDFWQKEMQSWLKLVNAYTAPTPLIKSTAAEITAGAATPLDKARKLYALVEKMDNVDYTRNAPTFVATEYVPRGSVESIIQRKAGNTEEITLLYLALARAAGLDARPERITSRSRRTFSSQLLETGQLDTVLIGLTVDGKEILLDPGQKMAPFETLHWTHAGAGGVAMDHNGKVEIVVTPLQVNTDNLTLRVGDLTMTPQGEVSGTLKVALTGQDALMLRQLALRTDAETVKQQMQQMLARQVPDGVQARVDRIVNLDDPDKQLLAIVPVTGSLSGHAGSHIVLPRVFFESKESDPFPADAARTLPVDVHYPSQEQEKITYHFPAGFGLEAQPQDATLKFEPNAAYSLKSTAAPGSITTGRVLARGFTLLDAADYGKLRDFYDKVALTDRQQVVLTGGQTSSK